MIILPTTRLIYSVFNHSSPTQILADGTAKAVMVVFSMHSKNQPLMLQIPFENRCVSYPLMGGYGPSLGLKIKSQQLRNRMFHRCQRQRRKLQPLLHTSNARRRHRQRCHLGKSNENHHGAPENKKRCIRVGRLLNLRMIMIIR